LAFVAAGALYRRSSETYALLVMAILVFGLVIDGLRWLRRARAPL
jgi:uncharacterized membrane protein YdcZ (DUF606 family)